LNIDESFHKLGNLCSGGILTTRGLGEGSSWVWLYRILRMFLTSMLLPMAKHKANIIVNINRLTRHRRGGFLHLLF
jgi:hypothetical protein